MKEAPPNNIKRRRLLGYIVVLLLLVGIAAMTQKKQLWSNQPFHENISLISAITSFFAGVLALVRYYAKKTCPYLWIGVAFLGNAMLELVYVYAFSFFPSFQIHAPIASFMTWGWWLSRTYLAIMLAGSFATCRTQRTDAQHRKQELQAYLTGSVLVLVGLYLLLYVSLPEVRPNRIFNRPLELLPAIIFFVPLIGFFRHSRTRYSPFAYWLILSLVVCIATQLFIIPFSGEIYDTNFMMGNVLRALAHVLVVVGLQFDIYKSYRQAENRAERIAILHLMVDQVKDYAFFLLDPKGYVMTWNKGAQLLKGYTEKEIVGKHFSIFYTQADLNQGKPEIEMRVAKEEGHFEDEGWRVRKDGSRFWANVIVTPIYNTANEFIGYSKITRDLTERKRIEDEIKKQNLMLTQSNEQLEQYAYIATHDLKEPLRSISSFTELLMRKLEPQPEGLSVYADYIREAIDRTRTLVDGLRIYSKVGRELAEQQTLVDLNEPLHNATTLLRMRIEETRAIITARRLPKVKGIASQLMYLFLHLIDNAIKYAKPGTQPRIEIKCHEAGNEYLITVSDNGIGIPGEYKDKVFNLFQKLNPGDQPGTGIGLAIVRKIVSAHGGKIEYSSNETGTTFNITFPAP